jgi:hypothetical protein
MAVRPATSSRRCTVRECQFGGGAGRGVGAGITTGQIIDALEPARNCGRVRRLISSTRAFML